MALCWTKRIDERIELDELNECINTINEFYIERAEKAIKETAELDSSEELKSVYKFGIKIADNNQNIM